MTTHNFAATEATICDIIESSALPADLADLRGQDREYIERAARRLRITPVAALSLIRQNMSESVAHSRYIASVVAEARATANRF